MPCCMEENTTQGALVYTTIVCFHKCVHVNGEFIFNLVSCIGSQNCGVNHENVIQAVWGEVTETFGCLQVSDYIKKK